MESLNNTLQFYNGYRIPCVGFGTWQAPDGETTKTAVMEAIKAGYRHIDGAAVYGNESSVGEGIKESGVGREELFVTSKVWVTNRRYTQVIQSFEQSLADLQLDYLDLLLIHWPAAAHQCENWEEVNKETWRALTDLYKAGRVRAVGVSNFKPHHLRALMECEVRPMVNQIEYHPGLCQDETVGFCKANGIVVEAWSPLGTGIMLKNPILMEIAEKYHKSAAQLCIRWCIQNGVIPLPKSVTPSRIIQNADVFDFEISEEDMSKINSLPYSGGSGLEADQIEF